MKRYIITSVLLLLSISCEKKENQAGMINKTNIASEKSISQSNNTNIDKIESSKSNKDESIRNKPEVVSDKIINKKIKEFTIDTHNCSTEEKINMALEKLGLRKMSKDEIDKPGIYIMDDVVNKIFDISRPVTSNDISDLIRLDQKQLVDLADELLDYNLIPERLAVLYEVCLKDCNSPYVRANAACQLAYIKLLDENAVMYDDTQLLNLAITLARSNENDSEILEVELDALAQLDANYWNVGDYKNCLDIAKQRLDFALRNPDKHSGSLIGTSIKTQIDCLDLLGRSKQAQELLEKAKKMKNISKQYQKVFHSDEYNNKIYKKLKP